MEAVDLFLKVSQEVAVAVYAQGVRSDPGLELAAVIGQGVDKFPAVYLLLVGQAVAVAVHAVGVGF